MVHLTDKGYHVLVDAAPGHVETVRSLVYDGLNPEDVEDLLRIMGHILARLEGSDLDTTC